MCKDIKKDSTKELAKFFRELLISYCFQKHKLELKMEDFRMPKLSYKGNYVDFQRVRGKKGPSIQVVDKENTQQNQAKNMSKAKDNIVRDPQGLNAPEWSFLLISNGNDPNYEDDDKMEFDGFNFNTNEAKGIEITIKLPLMTTGKFFNLQISDKSLYLRCGRFYELNISLPI